MPAQLTLSSIAILSYNASYLLVTDLYALILIAATVHSLQYHVISLARNNGRIANQTEKELRQCACVYGSRETCLPIYFVLLFIISRHSGKL